MIVRAQRHAPEESRDRPTSPVGLHRVLEPAGALPQAAERLDAAPAIGPGRGPDAGRAAQPRRRVLPPARRPSTAATATAVRAEVLEIVAARGKMQNPVTGSGGMLVGVVDEVGPESPLGLQPGDRVATLVSLSLTPLRITDGLARWDGRSEQVPAEGTRSCSAARSRPGCPTTCPASWRWPCMDVCGAPALTAPRGPRLPDAARRVAVIGGAGKSGSLSLAAARRAGRRAPSASCRSSARPTCCARSASPTTSPSPTPATRSRSRPRSSARSGGAGRRHRGLRRRARLRARRGPRHRRRRHGDLLLDGHLVLRRRAGRRGAGRRRHHADRQRLRARATPSSRWTCCAPSRRVRSLFERRLAQTG